MAQDTNKLIKFSIITPVYLHSELRQRMFARCCNSIITQTYPEWQHILVDDGSKVAFAHPKDERQTVKIQAHLERLYGYNEGLKSALGDWICFLDSDDEYLSTALQMMYEVINAYPEYKLFNFGSIHMHKGYDIGFKPPFEPKALEKGHEVFRSGKIVNGTFIFHRSLYDELGGFPQTTNCWEFRDKAFAEFPEIKSLYQFVRPETGKIAYRELGNPWGQDWYLFYKFTRHYYSKPINRYYYLVHPREGHEFIRTD